MDVVSIKFFIMVVSVLLMITAGVIVFYILHSLCYKKVPFVIKYKLQIITVVLIICLLFFARYIYINNLVYELTVVDSIVLICFFISSQFVIIGELIKIIKGYRYSIKGFKLIWLMLLITGIMFYTIMKYHELYSISQ